MNFKNFNNLNFDIDVNRVTFNSVLKRVVDDYKSEQNKIDAENKSTGKPSILIYPYFRNYLIFCKNNNIEVSDISLIDYNNTKRQEHWDWNVALSAELALYQLADLLAFVQVYNLDWSQILKSL